MSLQFCSFASSSAGNCYFIQSSGGTSILVDAGVPLRRLERNLRSIGVDPRQLQGIFLTHAHRDHVASYLIKKPFATRYDVPTYASTGTWRELLARGCGELNHDLCHRLEPGQSVQVGGLRVYAHAKSHDAAGAVCFEIKGRKERLAVVTDLGCLADSLLTALQGCTYYIFEANHDVIMEQQSARPWVLKQRVLSAHGHLSNEQAAAALAILAADAKGIWLAHISEECNCPDLACRVVEAALQHAGLRVPVMTLPARDPSPIYGNKDQGQVVPLQLWDLAD
ncbi:MAG: MBL fold metallo-hydrolase [Firmicutes bacterium]|nr:MBL fold metallo-hydrolase [Bacillota bacterium]